MKPEIIDTAEALRYLGIHGEPDEITKKLLSVCLEELSSVNPKAVWQKYPRAECPVPLIGNDITRHLAGCDEVILLAATLGAEADRLMRAATAAEMAKAVVMDAVQSAYIEAVCRETDKKIAEAFSGKYLTWRFSAGYGDYPLETEKPLIEALMANKKIGLQLTDSYMLMPQKSVTAIMGMSDDEIPKGRRGCAVCNMRNSCTYRKGGGHCGF